MMRCFLSLDREASLLHRNDLYHINKMVIRRPRAQLHVWSQNEITSIISTTKIMGKKGRICHSLSNTIQRQTLIPAASTSQIGGRYLNFWLRKAYRATGCTGKVVGRERLETSLPPISCTNIGPNLLDLIWNLLSY